MFLVGLCIHTWLMGWRDTFFVVFKVIASNLFKSLSLFGVESIMHTKFIFQLDVYFTIAMMYTSTTTCFVYKSTLYNTNRLTYCWSFGMKIKFQIKFVFVMWSNPLCWFPYLSSRQSMWCVTTSIFITNLVHGKIIVV